jgi:hypothetical protein
MRAGSPLSEMDEYRVEICLVLRKLERLDKDKFTEDERADAEEVCCTQNLRNKHSFSSRICRFSNSVEQKWSNNSN